MSGAPAAELAEKPPRSGFLERLLAFYIDAKIALLASAAVAVGLVACGLPEAAAGAVIPVLFAAYHAVFNTDSRQPPGKWIVGIRVVAADGGVLGRSAAIKRAGAYFVSAAPLGLGFLWALLRADKAAWHDRLASSAVVESRPRSKAVRAAITLAAIVVLAYNAVSAANYFYARGAARAARLTAPSR